MEVTVQEVSFILRVCDSDAIFLQCFDTSRISFLMFDKCIKKNLEIENFSSRECSS